MIEVITPPSIGSGSMERAQVERDVGLRRARAVTLSTVGSGVLGTLLLAAVGLSREDDPRWAAAGAVGVVLFVAAQSGVLYGAITPWLAESTRRRLLTAFVWAAVLSVPLVGPVGGPEWATWGFLGASVIGSVSLLRQWWIAGPAVLLSVATAAGVAAWNGAPVRGQVTIVVVAGLSMAAWNALQLWLWGLLVEAQRGRAAQGRLAATEERLRFARDVHDLLGHSLSVIALKAELASRLAATDAGRASREAAEVRRLAASALVELREVVHGYRAVDLGDQIAAVEQVLRSSGIRCAVALPPDDVPSEIARQLVAVLREASTNVLRHSRATWCTIEISQDEDEVRMTMTNDGAEGASPDRHSFGLRGLAERLAEAAGTLRHRIDDGVFRLDVTVRTRP
ncbi:histidine kinase [Micromonospora peucetia]|uniref:Histidine kinase n=1 Tax=Micromonospora peucetia TaxID=47871 RepID=A0A1C6U7Z8_9ACTN|nr:histidine kinase [Micromonospora peucetia]MCX4386259.1 histidine kinase [Micromonospora peucetia]WSA33602.1 histidine kinase [Micromonospora peucetia]SCL50225.1 two-component system, NarL family, sensor histidine kinase DesK [Micromonospora peucetia]